MELHWRPVGPEPEQTYWARRAVVALVALVLVVLVVSLLTGGDEPDRVAQATASPVPSAAAPSLPATPLPSPTPTTVPCTPEALKVGAAATEESYAVGASPKLELTITNTGTVPCTRDLGAAAVELRVTSGADRIWSSDDCAKPGGVDVVTLAPGKSEISRVTWSGKRSRPGCTGDQERAEAGTYRVSGRVGDRTVEGQPFLLR